MGEFITAEEARKMTIEKAIEKINNTIKGESERGYTSCVVGDVLDLPTEAVNNIFKQLKECGYTLYPEVINYFQVALGITWQGNWNKQKYLDNCKIRFKDTVPSSYELLLEYYTTFNFD